MDDLVICEAILEVLIKEAEMPSVIDPSTIPTGGTKMTAIDNKSGKPVQVEKIVGPDGKDIIKVEPDGDPVENIAPESSRVKDLSPVATT